VTFGQPVKNAITNNPPINNSFNNTDYGLERIYLTTMNYFSSGGSITEMPSGSGTVTATHEAIWNNPTEPTIVANKYYPMTQLWVPPGRAWIINKIEIETSKDCNISLFVSLYLLRTIAGTNITSTNYNGQYFIYRKRQIDSTGGTVTFQFDIPLILKYGQFLSIYYTRNDTTGVNYRGQIFAQDVTNDFNFEAEKKVLYIGDSITGITNESGANQDSIWTFSIIDSLKSHNINARQVNLAIGGTDAITWESMCRDGFIDKIKPDLTVINIGMNDCNGANELSTVGGVDGYYKQAMKKIIKRIYNNNNKCSIVLNSVTPTVVATKIGVISGGVHDGLTYVAALRIEQTEIVAELKSIGIDVYLCNMSTLWNGSDGTYYVTGVNTDVHPSVAKGQPLMSSTLFTTIKNTTFYYNKDK
jgi:lysophospholipase L1-like esterase